MDNGILFLLGEFGTGKDYLSQQLELLDEIHFHKMLQVTTREKRENEKDGVDGHFISKKDFLSLLEKKLIMSWSLIKRTGNYYGNLYSEYDFKKINVIGGDPDRLDNLLKDREKINKIPIWVVYLNASDKTKIERYRLRDSNFSEKEIVDRIKDQRFSERMKEHRLFTFSSFWNDGVSSKDFLIFVKKLIEDIPNGML